MPSAWARLTERERSVLVGVIAGRTNPEIAASMGISPRTVEVYRSRVFDKLDVSNAVELTKFALSTGLLL